MRAGVGDEPRQDDRADTLGDHEPEQDFERGDEQQKYEELTKLDADIERQQRSQQVRSGELQRLAEREREAESVNETEPEGDHLPALQIAVDDVLERHVEEGDGDERFDER